MQAFRTIVDIPASNFGIDYRKKILFIGSCFTENIGNRLASLRFPLDINPFGVLYNPLSVKNSLELLLQDYRFSENDLRCFNDLWYSFYHHSDFSHQNKAECLKKINRRIEKAAGFVKQAHAIFVTFGTAWVYRWKETGKVVSNCHKIPARKFERQLLDVDNIVEEYSALLSKIKATNPGVKVIFTVSPVRHLKDSAIGNQISKSTLLLAIDKMKQADVEYFPAYELMIDDLRDYRFYEKNMTHPNSTAVDYIFQRFSETYLTEESKKIVKKMEKLQKAREHKPVNPQSALHQKFILGQLNYIEQLKQQYPFLSLAEDEQYFRSFLANQV